MRRLTPDQLRPVVRIANWHDVQGITRWERSIPDLQFILIRQGRFTYHDDHGTVAIAPGEVLCIQPGRHHVFALAAGQRRGAISGFHVELTSEGTWLAGDYRLDPAPAQVTRPAAGAALRDCFRRAAAAWAGHTRWRQALASVAVHEALLLLAAHWGEAHGSAQAHGEDQTRQMVAWLCQHARRGVGRAGLARHFGCSVETIDRRFRRSLGQTPTQIRHREQCRLAWECLHLRGGTVAQAAAAGGFSDPFYFSRIFRRVYGYPPSRAR